MRSGICTLSLVPCRKEPTSTSEMVTQLLFGEIYEVLEAGREWVRIRTTFDNYESWISSGQHTSLNERDLRRLQQTRPAYAGETTQLVKDKSSGLTFPVVYGASLALCAENLEEHSFSCDSETIVPPAQPDAGTVLAIATKYLNAPYLWGGRSPFGIDCSGYVQMACMLGGVCMPRDARQQVEIGQSLSFVEEAAPGDLAFFDNEEGNIVHVGFVTGSGTIMHASGRVRIDKFDHYGIFRPDLRGYSHHLRVIKRIFPAT